MSSTKRIDKALFCSMERTLKVVQKHEIKDNTSSLSACILMSSVLFIFYDPIT